MQQIRQVIQQMISILENEMKELLNGCFEKNFLRPDKPYKITGQINQVCFIEGHIPFGENGFCIMAPLILKLRWLFRSIERFVLSKNRA
ncbi:MAG: hypothetical protein ACOVMQ_11720 [Cyclobacteriaceae bacterium]|jgi:hypothetical protein|nr:hypothetical protein [Flammeovirgaceae bacterium]